METTPTKAGWKTSEFYLTILTNVITIVGSLQGVIPPQTAAIILAVANGIYGLLRTIAKGQPSPESTNTSTNVTVK